MLRVRLASRGSETSAATVRLPRASNLKLRTLLRASAHVVPPHARGLSASAPQPAQQREEATKPRRSVGAWFAEFLPKINPFKKKAPEPEIKAPQPAAAKPAAPVAPPRKLFPPKPDVVKARAYAKAQSYAAAKAKQQDYQRPCLSFWRQGYCNRGGKCPWSHTVPPTGHRAAAGPVPPAVEPPASALLPPSEGETILQARHSFRVDDDPQAQIPTQAEIDELLQAKEREERGLGADRSKLVRATSEPKDRKPLTNALDQSIIQPPQRFVIPVPALASALRPVVLTPGTNPIKHFDEYFERVEQPENIDWRQIPGFVTSSRDRLLVRGCSHPRSHRFLACFVFHILSSCRVTSSSSFAALLVVSPSIHPDTA